ncbi:MAG: tryptophanase [Anaerolineales bacterium]|nr:tryptophanase [Anaerolineales bacterium]MDW8447499.1 tryptophanase [Anaerolineales bacterium]
MDLFSEAEPYRIKVVEPLKLTTRSQREETLRKAHYNLFNVPAEEVFVDLLTDSGTSAMSQYQWAGIMTGDESYAGCRNWFHLQEVVREITGYPYVVPTHQGRPAENILMMLYLQPGLSALGNMFFDTTHAHVLHKGGVPHNLVIEEGLDATAEHPFKGNIDLDKLEDFLRREGREKVGLIHITITCNNNGGQPVSMENLRGVRAIADKYGVPFYLDAARFAENAYFIKQREPGYEKKSIREIAREMFSYADGCTMSSKKDGLVNIGGFLALRDEQKYRQAQQYLILLEGFVTYGGMAGRDLEALAIGLQEALDEAYLASRVRQVHLLGHLLLEAGVPTVRPIGGHCVMIDMKRFLPHIPQEQYPAEAFVAELYLDSGTRGCGLGQLAFGSEDPDTGEVVYSPLEVVRLAIPRRVYTDNHIRHVAKSVIRLYERREELRGMRLLWAPPGLRHFTAHLEPLGQAQPA